MINYKKTLRHAFIDVIEKLKKEGQWKELCFSADLKSIYKKENEYDYTTFAYIAGSNQDVLICLNKELCEDICREINEYNVVDFKIYLDKNESKNDLNNQQS